MLKKVEVPNFYNTEIRSIWFSYIDYRDYMQNLDKKEFSKKVKDIVTNIYNLKFNTIYVHAVSFTDAFYESKIYPKTQILPNIEYDPLEIFINEAHKKGIRVEAWINPMRSIKTEEVNNLNDDFIVKKWINENKPYIKMVNDRYYLNPAYKEVKDLIVSVVDEITSNYKVDGIHMDDYFYPENADESFDSEVLCTGCDVAEFRKNNVNEMVSLINQSVKKKNLIFGISPSGNMEYSINTIYGDFNMWVDTGIVDYLIPQIYWGYDHPTKPYLKTLEEWKNVVLDSDVKLIVGLAGYKVGVEDSYAGDGKDEWINNSDILSKQYMDAVNMSCHGVSIFAYNSLFFPKEELKSHVENEINSLKTNLK